MRRITLWALSTLSAVVLLFGYHTSTSGVSDVTAAPAQTGSFSSGSSSTSNSSSSTSGAGAGSGGGTGGDTTDTTPSTSPSASPSSRVQASSGAQTTKTVAGSVIDTRWGPVQVEVIVTGSKITNASVLEYPQNNGRDIEINNQALPILTRETVDAQSADIDMVSGATYTSDGYIQSLQSALDKAGL